MLELSDGYSQMAVTARAWASDTSIPGHLLGIVSTFAEDSAILSGGIHPDESTLASFRRLGCYLCGRLGHAVCLVSDAVISECPLGFDAEILGRSRVTP